MLLRKNVSPLLRRIVEVFPHYTCHDDSHSEAIVKICNWVAGEDLLRKLNGPELFVLFASMYFHDIGMVVSPDERDEILVSSEFISYKESNPEFSDTEALAEWIRRQHHERSGEVIRQGINGSGSPLIDDRVLAYAVALVCESHGKKDLTDFELYDTSCAWGYAGETICLPLLGVLPSIK